MLNSYFYVFQYVSQEDQELTSMCCFLDKELAASCQYLYLLADELAENANARNHEECAQANGISIELNLGAFFNDCFNCTFSIKSVV